MTNITNYNDAMLLLDVREMLIAMCMTKGEFKVIGSGFGMGDADIQIEFKGRFYNINIKEE
jgi:hypothetical protein